jgi:hypothetical protein
MTEQEYYTEIFKKELIANPLSYAVKDYKKLWLNPVKKPKGGLRLSEFGYKVLSEHLDLAGYAILLPKNLDLKPHVLVYLDQFLNCPYYLDKMTITVYSERKAIELHLFAGDIAQYGLNKAKSRQRDLQNNNTLPI